MIPFRHHHLFILLRSYEGQNKPLDRWVHDYFRIHKALGSKDRLWISETVYALIRWRGLWGALGAKDWEACLKFHEEGAPDTHLLPPHTRCSFPKWLFDKFTSQYGEKAFDLALASNSPAPLTVRVNRLKGSREELLEKWGGEVLATPCMLSDVGLRIEGRRQLLTLPEYQEGWFEIQDEASQRIAQLVGAGPGEEGLDYCAGSGGKTLALAAEMANKGQIFLHDVRPKVLYKARRRMKRAGVQNAQIPKKLKRGMDWVLVDAPCSGTGTLRRNPDAKWRLTPEKIEQWGALQREIVAEAVTYLAPEGRLIYATCSLLEEENGGQLAYFEKELGLKPVAEPFQSLPKEGEMDGFYGVVLTRCRES